jgi:hypothetical protein
MDSLSHLVEIDIGGKGKDTHLVITSIGETCYARINTVH